MAGRRVIVTGANSYSQVTLDNAQRFGELLWRANEASVGYRYQGRESPAGDYTFGHYEGVSPAAALGCAICFDYQACKPGDYDQSAAKGFVSQLIEAIARKLAGETPWGVCNQAEIKSLGFARKVEGVRLSTLLRRPVR